MVDIEINAWSSLFLNLETNLILCLYPEKCIKLNQSEWRIRSWEIENWKYRDGKEELSNLKKTVFDLPILLMSYQWTNVRLNQHKFGLTFKINLLERNEFLFCSNALMDWKLVCEQLTLQLNVIFQSDISPIDIASHP